MSATHWEIVDLKREIAALTDKLTVALKHAELVGRRMHLLEIAYRPDNAPPADTFPLPHVTEG